MEPIELSIPTFQPSKLSGRDLVSYLAAIKEAKADLAKVEGILKTEAKKRFAKNNTSELSYSTGTLKLSHSAGRRSWNPDLLKYYDTNSNAFTKKLAPYLKPGTPSDSVLVSRASEK